METKETFKDFLPSAFEQGQYATDDVIAFVLPLFEEVLGFHESNFVAPFERPETLFITNNRLDIDETKAHAPKAALEQLKQLTSAFNSKHFEVIGQSRMEVNVDEGIYNVDNMQVHWNINDPLQSPAYIPGYDCYEKIIGHHDAQTDIFCLGLVLGSMALSLDLYDKEDLETFASYRKNPVQFNPRLSTLILSNADGRYK